MGTSRARFRPFSGFLALLMVAGAGAALVAFDMSTPGAPATRYRYDTQRRVVSRTTADGRASRYFYDAAGRLTRVTFHRRGGLTGWFYPASRTLEARFDPAGRRVATSVDGTVDQWLYDDAGRVRGWRAADGVRLSYDYDAWGRVRSIELPQLRLEQRYDILGRVVQTSAGAAAVRFRYEPHAVTRTVAGVTSRFESARDGRLLRIRHERDDGRPLAEVRYSYDERGRVSMIAEATERGQSTAQYAYDAAGRLTQFIENGQTTRFQYDAMGNRIREDGPAGTVAYTYDDLGRLTRAGGATYSYDLIGNVVARTDSTGQQTYRYNEEHRLVEVRTGRHVIRYGYDADGNRTSREIDGRTTRYVADALGADATLAVRDPDGTWSVQLPGSARVSVRGDGRVLTHLEGALGSTRWVVGEHGAVVHEFAYSAFGVPRAVQGSLGSETSFAGGAWDAEAGLLFLRARYYDPQMGRFLSPDPLPARPYAPHSFNRYAYADNDPVNYFDPEGLQARQANPPQPALDPERYRATWLDAQQQALETVAVDFAGRHPGLLGNTVLALSALDYAVNEMAPWRAIETEVRKLMDPQFTQGHPIRTFGAGLRIAWETVSPVGEVSTGVKVALGKGIPLAKRIDLFEATHWTQKRISLPFGLDPRYPASKTVRLPYEQTMEVVDAVTGTFDLGQRLSAFPAVRDAAAQGLAAAWRFNPARTLIDPFGIGERLPFLPPPGGGGSSVPAVGGVYLDQTARMIGSLRGIAGATYDPGSGRLVLIGATTTALPPLRPEYVAAALRSVFSNEPHEAGMTIDPDPRAPRGPTMIVRFFGGTEQTRLGWTMFESDRVMKGLSVGVDSLSRREMHTSVAGFRSVTAMGLESPASGPEVWSRFWLVPDPVTARVSDDGHSILFDPIVMRVKTETMRWTGGRLVQAGNLRDPHAEAFADHFTRHYDDFANEYPIFAELKQVTGAVALAKWMRDQHVPVDWNAIDILVGEPFPTPGSTPSVSHRLTATSTDGAGRLTRTVSAFGGVEMTPRIRSRVDGNADALRGAVAAALDSRANTSTSFYVDVDGARHQAVVLSPSRTRPVGGYDRREIDFTIGGELAAVPGVVRWYNSLHNERSEFGRSWSLLLPRLHFEAVHNGGRSEYVGVAGDPASRVLVQHFRLTNAFGVGDERFVAHFIDRDLRRVGFRPETARDTFRGLYPERDGYRIVFSNGDQAVFDARGRLAALFTTPVNALYRYDERGQLQTIEMDHEGRRVDLHLERDERQRIRAATLAGDRVEYRFDAGGNLASATRGRDATQYAYDERGLLHSVREGGRTTVENRYDNDGRLVEQTDGAVIVGQSIEQQGDETIVTLRAGTDTVRKVLDRHQRLVRFESAAYTQQWTFDADGRVTRTDVSWPAGGRTTTAFSPDRRTIVSTDPTGARAGYRLDDRGRLVDVAINERSLRRYRYDPRSNIAAVEHADGSLDEYGYDGAGRLREIRRMSAGADQAPEIATFEYDPAGLLISIAGSSFGSLPLMVPAAPAIPERPAPALRYERDAGGRIVAAHAPDNATYGYAYDARHRLSGVQLPGRRCVRYGYDGESDRLASVGEAACR